MRSVVLHRYALLVAASTLILIAAGGLVTSTDSGLSVPDWPLSYGQVMPPMIGGIRFEHTHRLIAGTVGLLTLGLAVLAWRAERRRWARWLALGAFGTVVLQAVLGGLTVIYLLPDWISVTHACLAQTFLCLVGVLALVTAREWSEAPRIESRYAGSIQRLLITTTAFIYLQLIAGAIVRHSGQGLRYHFVLAFLIALHSLFIILKCSREQGTLRALFGHALLLGGLVTAQAFLGFASFILTRRPGRGEVAPMTEVLSTTVHQTLGALILLVSLLLTLRSYRLLARRRNVPESHAPEPASGVFKGLPS